MTTFTTQDRQDAERTPLTEEEVQKIWRLVLTDFDNNDNLNLRFARAIERAHGIGE
jgi:CRISPR/Cas system type I-B associated protein Csh2 (Cas7 group RAMP superfamily)